MDMTSENGFKVFKKCTWTHVPIVLMCTKMCISIADILIFPLLATLTV